LDFWYRTSGKVYNCSGYFLGLPHPDPLSVWIRILLSTVLLNFENDGGGLAEKMLFCERTDFASVHFSPSLLSLSPLASITNKSASAQLCVLYKDTYWTIGLSDYSYCPAFSAIGLTDYRLLDFRILQTIIGPDCRAVKSWFCLIFHS
jgi:hypothetical protein